MSENVKERNTVMLKAHTIAITIAGGGCGPLGPIIAMLRVSRAMHLLTASEILSPVNVEYAQPCGLVSNSESIIDYAVNSLIESVEQIPRHRGGCVWQYINAKCVSVR